MSGKKHLYGEPLSYLGNEKYPSGPGYGMSPRQMNKTVDYS